jgi:hypothetical protein
MFKHDSIKDLINNENFVSTDEIFNFVNQVGDKKWNSIKQYSGGGAWDENFFMILSIIGGKERNEMSSEQINQTKIGLELLKTNDRCTFKNRVFVNPQIDNNQLTTFKGEKEKLINEAIKYVENKPKIMSHVFTNWSVYSNSNQNLLRFDTSIKKFNEKILEHRQKQIISLDEVLNSQRLISMMKLEESDLAVEILYINFIIEIYKTNGQKEPYYHPIEIYFDRTLARKARSKHCFDDDGKYDTCFEQLREINDKTLGIIKHTDYNDFITKLAKICNKLNLSRNFVIWLISYLFMFEPEHTPVNLEEDNIFLYISKEFKHCLFTRKILG